MPEPRKVLRSGHISGSVNVPFKELVNEDGTLKSNSELGKIFTQKDIDITKTSVCSCGSGLSACIIGLGLNVLGNEKVTIYDGSWSEYVSSLLTLLLILGSIS